MAEAPQISGRQFPDANQVGIASGTLIAQSRITFNGQRGLVHVSYHVPLINGGAVAISTVSLSVTLSGLTMLFPSSIQGWFDAVAGRTLTPAIEFWLLDPPDGAFCELTIALTGGTITITALNGRVRVESWEPGQVAGPVVTIS